MLYHAVINIGGDFNLPNIDWTKNRISCTTDKDIWDVTLRYKILYTHAILPRSSSNVIMSSLAS